MAMAQQQRGSGSDGAAREQHKWNSISCGSVLADSNFAMARAAASVLGSVICQAIQRRPSIRKILVKIALLDHKILENRITLLKNVGRQRG
jgi:hypothetical protein